MTLTLPDIAFYLYGAAAPLWRAAFSYQYAFAVNVASFALVAILIGFCAFSWLRVHVDRESEDSVGDEPPRLRIAPWFLAATVFLISPFAAGCVRLTGAYFALVPVACAFAFLAACQFGESYERKALRGVFLFLSGAFAAVGAWEGTFGLVATPIMAVLAVWLMLERAPGPRLALAFWSVGFVLAFALEGLYLPGLTLGALKPSLPVAWSGLGLVVILGLSPLFIVQRYGERWPLIAIWALILAGLGIAFAIQRPFKSNDAFTRFAERIYDELGERKVILSDGLFDGLVELYKPADVRLIGSWKTEDRLCLLELTEDGSAYTNKVFALRDYACVLVSMDRPEEAVSYARKAVKGAPGDWTMRQPLVGALINLKRYDEANRELEELRRVAREARCSFEAEDFAIQAEHALK